MRTGHQHGTDHGGTGSARPASCAFPECERSATTRAGMCDQHRQVAVSSTGSWLEAKGGAAG